MISLEQANSIGKKFNCIECPILLQAGDDNEKWKLIVRLQNSLGAIECLMFLNILSNILTNKPHTEATIDNRLTALYEISIL